MDHLTETIGKDYKKDLQRLKRECRRMKGRLNHMKNNPSINDIESLHAISEEFYNQTIENPLAEWNLIRQFFELRFQFKRLIKLYKESE